MTTNARYKVVDSKGRVVATFRYKFTADQHKKSLQVLHLDNLEVQPIEENGTKNSDI